MVGKEEGWLLVNFEEEFDKWTGYAGVPDEIQLTVLEWVVGRSDDPYSGAIREPIIGNLWRCRIPVTLNDHGELAYCVYYIYESGRIVYCRGFSMNSWL